MTDHPHITAPALRDSSGEVWHLPNVYSHADLLMGLLDKGWRGLASEMEPGFVDSTGEFHTRFSAQRVASKAGQLHSEYELDPMGLQSWHLWDESGAALWR